MTALGALSYFLSSHLNNLQAMTTEYFREAHDFMVNNSTFTYYNEPPPEDIQQKLEQKLKPVTGTGLNKSKVCLEGTRTDIIQRISQWIKSPNGSQTLLLCGEAGTGKSTISHTIGSNFEHQLGAFFCFNRSFPAARTPSNALRTIAYMLGIKFPEIGKKLLAKIQENPNILESTSIQDLWETLIVHPAQVMAHPDQQVLIIVDALDESGQREDGQRDELLPLLFDRLHELPQGFHVFITSRPESDVIKYKDLNPPAIQVQHMSDIKGTCADIYQYICSRMMKNRGSGKLNKHQCKILAERAGEFFQWAVIVCTSLSGQGKGGMSVPQRYERFMDLNKPSSSDLHALDKLYEFIFKDALDVDDEDAMEGYRSIMSQVLAAFEPLSQATLQKLQTGNDVDTVSSVLSFLGSLFTGISKSDNTQVKPVHTSVLDFLLDKTRSKRFWVDLQQGHELLAKGSFHVMFRDLHFNMGKLESSYVMNSEIKDLGTKLSDALTLEIKYACCWWDLHFQNMWQGDSWVKNMERSDSQVKNKEQSDSWVKNLEKFFFHYSLYWMEVLGLMNKIHIASRTARHTITFLDNLKNKIKYSELKNCMTDILAFIQVFGKVITTSTPHLYLSGMPFVPENSQLHKVFENCCDTQQKAVFSRKIDNWPDQQVILRDHTDYITAVAFSPDGRKIVSGSWDKTIRIWNADTGEAIGNPLQGHSDGVTSVAFSPDGKRIVSGSEDGLIRIWNVDTREAIGDPLQGYSHWVNSVAFSPDGKRIVSGFEDGLIIIWNADTGEAIGDPLQGNLNLVTSVAFSPDGKRIVSGSADCLIRIWNADTGEAIGNPLQRHPDRVSSVAFSPDGKRIVSGSWDKSISLWNADTGEAIGDPLQGHSYEVTSVAFSPDGKRIVSGSKDCLIRIWNADTGEAIGDPLQGHSDPVSSVAFSPDGKKIVSGSWDKSIRIWNVDIGEVIGDPLQENPHEVTLVTFSPDDRRAVSLMQGSDTTSGNYKSIKHSQNPHPYLINQYFSFYSCHIDDEGWLHGWHSDLSFSVIIIWIPPKFRSTLVFPPTCVIISQDGSCCTLDLLNFACGKDWIQCSINNVAPVSDSNY
ncbi:WD40-repeat-containing domain protein [Lentinula detonsa]|uniref:WD40-repeat-containing domain protein n=1 Tax=Lentinula detonsa TaxID=2804962 RepID=A0AA38PQ06_9AGAR|nr:WD40-repeat-containing domain protein [Lentinula detonsa]